MLSHERLDVYQRAIEFLAAALRIAERLPRGQAERFEDGDEDDHEDEDGTTT